VVWGAAQGLVAAVLLLAGGLSALQTAAIAAALPISVLVVMMAWGVIKSLMEDPAAVTSSPDEAPDGTALNQDLHA
jgi:choline/glycine/proline betaine transport protein